ncbi:MAG: hydantoinase/oxoprolinase family protein [Desulfoferrobacter sp.]
MIIGLDVGGTHTDVVLIGQDCILRQVKVPTDPQNLLDCVWTGLEEVTKDVPPQDIRRAVLSTTLTTNAIAEKKLIPTGMIVCSGPGVDPECFRTNDHYYHVSGSIDHRGREVQPIDRMEIEAIASKMRSEGIRQVGVVGKFSVRNPGHEIEIREILSDSFDHVLLGHRLSGNLNFPRRIATTYLNAAVYPLHKRFFDAVKDSLKKKGLFVPIYILKADGGTMSLEASLDSPGQTILSGPAASVMGSLPFAAEDEETLVLDIGGTTTDMAILLRQVPLLDPVGIELGGFKTLIRALRTKSVPVGGDSVVRLLGERITIGPDRQGPAMAYGGPAPTPTDALFVLGKTSDGDVEAARRGLQGLAEKLDVGVEEMAARIFDEACFNILNEAAKMISDINSKPVYTVHELLEGYQVQPKEILVLGGPAPHFAFRLSRLTDFEVHVVPQWQVANAVGAALARNTCEVTVFADTERGIVIAPEENFSESVKRDYSKEAALELAFELLRKKFLAEGAGEGEMEMEILEELQFNMVRGFHTIGKNIRIKVQVKPGLIPEYKDIAQTLFNYCPLPS